MLAAGLTASTVHRVSRAVQRPHELVARLGKASIHTVMSWQGNDGQATAPRCELSTVEDHMSTQVPPFPTRLVLSQPANRDEGLIL